MQYLTDKDFDDELSLKTLLTGKDITINTTHKCVNFTKIDCCHLVIESPTDIIARDIEVYSLYCKHNEKTILDCINLLASKINVNLMNIDVYRIEAVQMVSCGNLKADTINVLTIKNTTSIDTRVIYSRYVKLKNNLTVHQIVNVTVLDVNAIYAENATLKGEQLTFKEESRVYQCNYSIINTTSTLVVYRFILPRRTHDLKVIYSKVLDLTNLNFKLIKK